MSHIIRFESFLHFPNFFYRSVGIDLWGTQGGRFHEALFFFSIINVVMWLLSEIAFAVLNFTKNFVQATMTLSYAGFVFVGAIKLYYMWRKKQELTRFLTLVNAIFPRTEQQQKSMNLQQHLRQSSIVMGAFSLIYMLLIWTYNLYPWVQRELYDCWLHVRTIPKALPYESYIPWNINGHWSFYVCYILQSFAGYHSAAGQIANDLVLCAMATQMIMHYECVAHKIADYQPRFRAAQKAKAEGASADQQLYANSQWKVEGDAYFEDMKVLTDIIAYHANVLSLSDIMNEVFGVPLLVNFVTSSSVICFVGFQMTMDPEPDYMVKLSIFLFSSLIQIYLICHYGQVLMDTSVNVAQAVFDQNWTNAHVRYQQMLVLVAARAQKPAMLKATSFVRVSRGTMTDIMQVSYKFFTLINTMYGD